MKRNKEISDLIPAQSNTSRALREESFSRLEDDKTDGVELAWGPKDTFILPPWRWHQHVNTSRTERAILFSESDLPVLEALDLYREVGD